MFLIFLSLLSRLCCTERMLDIGLLLVSSVYFLSFGVPVIREFWDSPLGGILCEYEVTRYFQFFALGIFCRKYWNQFARLLTKDWFKTFFIVIFVMCLCFMNLIENSQISPHQFHQDSRHSCTICRFNSRSFILLQQGEIL